MTPKELSAAKKYIHRVSNCKVTGHNGGETLYLLCGCGEEMNITYHSFRKRKNKMCTTCKKNQTLSNKGSTYSRTGIRKVSKGYLGYQTYIVKSAVSKKTYTLKIMKQDDEYRICNLTKNTLGEELYRSHALAEKSISNLIDKQRLSLIAKLDDIRH